MQEEEYIRHDATALAALLRRREVSAAEVLEIAIARLARWNGAINAVVIPLQERARAEVRRPLPEGPFAGVPFLVKDLDGFLADTEFTGSCKALLGWKPPRDSELFLRYQRAGLVIFGKTNTPELGLVGTTESLLRGPARNPWHTSHSTGGSSGGSAAAVAARIVPMAHAGDGGGSIRIPASACGLFGLKPTRGRTPLGPDESELWSGLVQRHAVTRSVRDSAALLDASAGPEPGALYGMPLPERPFAEEVRREPGRLRIAFSTGSLFGRSVHPECAKAVSATAKLLASLGHEVSEDAPPVAREALVHAFLVMLAACTAAAVRQIGTMRGRAVTGSELEPRTQFLARLGESLSAAEYEEARQCCHAGVRAITPFFERYDVFVDATMAYPPPRIGEWDLPRGLEAAIRVLAPIAPRRLMLGALESFAADALERTANTMLFNMSGQPAMSVPLGWSGEGSAGEMTGASSREAVPIGVQFCARSGEEAMLFRLAAQLERAAPWAELMPPEPG